MKPMTRAFLEGPTAGGALAYLLLSPALVLCGLLLHGLLVTAVGIICWIVAGWIALVLWREKRYPFRERR